MFYVDRVRQVTAVVMSRPEERFAIVNGYNSDNFNDPFQDQNPLYFSLFGDDLLIGDEQRAQVRLVVVELDEELQQ